MSLPESAHKLADVALGMHYDLREAIEPSDEAGEASGALSAPAPIDPRLLAIVCERLSVAAERLSSMCGLLSEHAEDLAEEWRENPALERPHPYGSRGADTDFAMALQLERAARGLDRAQRVLAEAGAMILQPEIEGLTEDLTVRLGIPDAAGRWVEVAAVDDAGQLFKLRDTSIGDKTPMHERPQITVTGAVALPSALATLMSIERRTADVLAAEASTRLNAMLEHRAQARRGHPVSADPALAADRPLVRAGRVWLDGALVAVLTDAAEHSGQPFPNVLARALLGVVDEHPDGVAGLLGTDGQDPDAHRAVRQLLEAGRRIDHEAEPVSTGGDLTRFGFAAGWHFDAAERDLRRIVARVDEISDVLAPDELAELRAPATEALAAIAPLGNRITAILDRDINDKRSQGSR